MGRHDVYIVFRQYRWCLSGVLSFILLPTSLALADADLSKINPIQSFKEQMMQLNRDCAATPQAQVCIDRKDRLRQQIIKLRELCKFNKNDDRCGAIMEDKQSKGWRVEEFCLQNPYATKCYKRRERDLRRTKILRRFCSKNPDEKRCSTRVTTAKKGSASLQEYCKDERHKEEAKCRALDAKINAGKPKPAEDTNNF